MSSMHRNISGEVLVQHLDQDALTIDADLLAQRGRSARTLVKDGPLRLTLMALAPDGRLPAHTTDARVTIHVVQGDVTFLAIDREYALVSGDVLVFAAGVEHAARSKSGAVFLLTVVHGTVSSPDDAAVQPATRHRITEAARQRWIDDGGHQPGVTPPLESALATVDGRPTNH
jgi:quercetin dioxygenase-like cupin family protein